MKLCNENQVVMVDDNPGDAELAHICYERSKARNPWLWFSDGRSFLTHLRAVRDGTEPMPALVLLDLNMPGMSGLEVLAATRDDPYFRELPVVCMLTSSADPKDRDHATRLGAAGFMTKPDHIADYVRFFDELVD